MPFTTPILLIVPLNEDSILLWTTVEHLNYRSNKYNKNYIVPKGFVTNLASVPRVPFIWLIAGGVASAAAIVHDWLYTNGIKLRQIKSREEADNVFYEAMIETKVPVWKAWLMYKAVSLFGASRFNDN